MTWRVVPYRSSDARLLHDDEERAVFYGSHALEDAQHCADLLNADEANQ
jgi:hypothetical protein